MTAADTDQPPVCDACRRPLRDPVSVRRRLGPVCHRNTHPGPPPASAAPSRHPAAPAAGQLALEDHLPEQPTAVSPETVSAILRDPASPYYPAQIGVYCDGCRTTVEHDYLVSDDMDQPARFEVAREHLRRTEGWSCTEAGDFCPTCTPISQCPGVSEYGHGLTARIVHWGCCPSSR